jgi:DNA repair exonuclease SbcCD ATPase subunit
MERVTVSLTERHVRELEARERLGEADSRSGAVRRILDDYDELRAEYAALEERYEEVHAESERRADRVDDLEERLAARETRIETLEAQLAERSQLEAKIEDLPDKLRETESYSERRQRLLDEASLAQRAVWKVTGVPVEEIDAER